MVGALVALSLTLNGIGIGWGQPGGFPWHPDSIGGHWAAAEIPKLFGEWTCKYPRGQFLVLYPFYQPLLSHWAKHPVEAPAPDGPGVVKAALDLDRASVLIVIANAVSAFMGAAAVVAVFLAARTLFNDDLAAFLAGLALATTFLFVFYAHLGNLDVPVTFWFAWSLCFAVKSVCVGRWRHYVLFGALAGMAMATKDPVAGYVVGLFLALGIAKVARTASQGASWGRAFASLLSLRLLVAVLAAGLVFALLNDLLTSPPSFLKRMGHWIGGPGTLDFRSDHGGQWSLLLRALREMYYGMGWPLLLATAASVVYCAVRYRWKAAFAILPLAVFYPMVVAYVQITAPRYYIPAMAALPLATGKAFADLLRWGRLPRLARAAPCALVYLASLLYCIGLDLELVYDSRYRAEQWLAANTAPSDSIVALSWVAYAPRIHRLGRPYAFIRPRPKDHRMIAALRPHAMFLIVPEQEIGAPASFDPQALADLTAGRLGYRIVARFRNRYLYPRHTILGFAGWPMPRSSMVSPEIIILQRQ